MSSADLWEDGYPHGTVEGFLGGCRGGSCPAGVEHGLSCKRAKLLSNGDYRYKRLVSEGKTPAEIAAALAEEPHTAPAPTPDREKRHLKALEREFDDTDVAKPTKTKETRMPTPNDIAPTKQNPADAVAAEVPTPEPLPEPANETTDSLEVPTEEADPREPKWSVFTSPLTTDKWTEGLTARAKTDKIREIREWARANGYDVPTKGRIPQVALAAYARFEELLEGTAAPDQVVVTALEPQAVPDGIEPAIRDKRAEDAAELAALNAEADGEPDLAETWPGNRGDRVPTDPTYGEDLIAAGADPTELEVPLNPAVLAALDATSQACRVCGCTDWDCTLCIARTGSPCSWVEADLCSACAAEPDDDVAVRITREITASFIKLGEEYPRSGLLDETRDRIDAPADDFRPDWAGVTIPEAIRQARTIAARLEEQNAWLTQDKARIEADYDRVCNEASDLAAEVDSLGRSLLLVLRKWREATEKLEHLADAEEQLDIAADRIETQEHLIITLQSANDALSAALTARGPQTPARSPWWKRAGR